MGPHLGSRRVLVIRTACVLAIVATVCFPALAGAQCVVENFEAPGFRFNSALLIDRNTSIDSASVIHGALFDTPDGFYSFETFGPGLVVPGLTLGMTSGLSHLQWDAAGWFGLPSASFGSNYGEGTPIFDFSSPVESFSFTVRQYNFNTAPREVHVYVYAPDDQTLVDTFVRPMGRGERFSYSRPEGVGKFFYYGPTSPIDDLVFCPGGTAPTGTITVSTNVAGGFTIRGPQTYTGVGPTFVEHAAPSGTYTITFDGVTGFGTPASQTLDLLPGDSVHFTGTYLQGGTILVNTNLAAASFTISGAASYTGSGTSFTQNAVPAGSYTITYNDVPGYETPLAATGPVTLGGTLVFDGYYRQTCASVLAGAVTPQITNGTLLVRGITVTGGAMSATFTPKGATLAEAAALCGYHHFNWLQRITRLTEFPSATAHSCGQGISLGLNRLDPSINAVDADDLPFYLDEATDPAFPLEFYLFNNMTSDALVFFDMPFNECYVHTNPDHYTQFTTWLIGVTSNTYGSYDSYDPLFQWTWKSNLNFNGGGVSFRSSPVIDGGSIVGYSGGVYDVFPSTLAELPVDIRQALVHDGANIAFTRTTIDIRPKSIPNVVNLKSQGTVPVAILGAEDLSVLEIVPESIILDGARAARTAGGKVMASIEDVNADGLLDLVAHINATDLRVRESATEAVLTAHTTAGAILRGSDSVLLVP